MSKHTPLHQVISELTREGYEVCFRPCLDSQERPMGVAVQVIDDRGARGQAMYRQLIFTYEQIYLAPDEVMSIALEMCRRSLPLLPEKPIPGGLLDHRLFKEDSR